MKFLVTQELKQNPLLKQLVLFFTALLFVFLLSDMFLAHLQVGLTLSHASEVLLGNEESFIEPLLFDVLLERVHIGIFTSMLSLLLLSIIYMRTLNIENAKAIHLAFITAILAPISLLLAFSYGTTFIILWIGLFVFWHLCGFYMAMRIIRELLKK
jgi:hypothetical protein